jgi:glutathione S-transferase
MSDIKVFGRLTSANVQKVIWVLEELELPYDRENRGGRYGGLSDPAYLAMNPNGLVPVLRDGTLVLWESHAIMRYLSAEYADGLLFPGSPRERAVVDQWTDWTATRFQPAWIGVFWAVYRTRPERRVPAEITKWRDEAARCFAILDQRLSRVPYLGGDTLTYADIVSGIALYRWTTMGTEEALPGGVAAWHARLRERPAFRKAVEVDFSELRETF